MPALETIPDGGGLLTPSLVVAAVNDACPTVTGRSRESLIGTRLSRLVPAVTERALAGDTDEPQVFDTRVREGRPIRLRLFPLSSAAVTALSAGRLGERADEPWWLVTASPRPATGDAPELNPERTFDVLADADCRRLLAAATRRRTAAELARVCDVPRSTTYRKLDRLREAGLVTGRLAVTDEGRHPTTYARTLDSLRVELQPPVRVLDASSEAD